MAAESQPPYSIYRHDNRTPTQRGKRNVSLPSYVSRCRSWHWYISSFKTSVFAFRNPASVHTTLVVRAPAAATYRVCSVPPTPGNTSPGRDDILLPLSTLLARVYQANNKRL